MKDLHAAIMNIPCKHVQTNDPCVELTYQMGHRDARHAAAELAIAVTGPVAFSQFLSDVLTAAGLVSCGRQSKGLAERLSDGVTKFRVPNPAPQAQPAADLTDDEIWEIGKSVGNGVSGYDDGLEFARAVLAAQKGKS